PAPAPVPLGLRPEVVRIVREAMLSVVQDGTGQRARLEGIAVGGKTGSAQVVTHARLERDKKARALQPHGWFIFFTPAVGDRPALAGAVLVEHGVQGGQSAAPVVGRALARYYGVRPLGPGMAPPEMPVPDPSPMPALRAAR
ncbi:MAG TPA: penicillin-binding transpeptidase domain-containing protein, partial [Vicinamibacteria bacterium]|nr:penicillin-binding transpeptidase domain-containing protein [Vicinamibacteria bacterium]